MQKRLDLELYEKLVDAIAVSAEVQIRLKTALKEAFENPRSFYDEDEKYVLAWRGLTFSRHAHLTQKFVLIDKLIEANQMAEVDWKEDEEEVRDWINKILETKKYDFKLSGEIKYEDEETFEMLNLINDDELKTNGFCLEILDIDSDGYVFTIVPLDQKKLVAEMFARLK